MTSREQTESRKHDPRTSKQMAADYLQPIEIWTKSNHGSIQNLTKKIKEIAPSEKISRTMISRWLSGTVQPSLGNALLLSEAYQQLQTNK